MNRQAFWILAPMLALILFGFGKVTWDTYWRNRGLHEKMLELNRRAAEDGDPLIPMKEKKTFWEFVL